MQRVAVAGVSGCVWRWYCVDDERVSIRVCEELGLALPLLPARHLVFRPSVITLSGYEKTNWRTVTVTRRRVEQGARGGPGLNNQNAVAFDIRDGQKPGFQHQQSDPNKNLQEVEYENVEDVKNHEGRHDFFKFTLPVSQGSVLTRGQYTYPFQVQLPDFLPGSCALGRDPKKDLAL
eukprot:g3864.t1